MKLLGQVEVLKCSPKDIDQAGPVHFPYEIEDDVFFWCWQSGEREYYRLAHHRFRLLRPPAAAGVYTPYPN